MKVIVKIEGNQDDLDKFIDDYDLVDYIEGGEGFDEGIEVREFRFDLDVAQIFKEDILKSYGLEPK